jgi:Rad3-related DNA helicase
VPGPLPPWEEAPDHFPLPSFRPGQREALLAAAKALTEGHSVQLEAPVGSGKSPLAVALGRWAGGAIITTPLNSLVDQYERDFRGHKEVAVIKGRENYACDRTGGSAATAPCTYNAKARKECKCPFTKAKNAALDRPIVVTSMAMAMTAPWLPDKPLVIVDEAHNLEGGVARQVSLEFREEDLDLPRPGATMEEHLAWLPQALTIARDKVEAMEDEIDATYKAASDHDGLVWVPPDLLKGKDHWRGIVNRIAELLLDRKTTAEEWVVQERTAPGGARRVAYQPVTGTRFVRSKLLAKGRLAVLLTATPPTAHEVGLGEGVQRVVMPMRWPKQRRPVVLDFRGNMAKNSRDLAIPEVAKGIVQHASGKTIVHAHAYAVARALSGQLDLMGVKHVLQDPEDREASLARWMRGLEEVFISVRMNEGLDLRDELCRTQILAKMPWPDLGDPWVKARIASMGDGWMHREVARSITQAYGRAIRSEQDWANFVVLDQGFEGFYKRDKDLFPGWFREAVGLPKVVPPA